MSLLKELRVISGYSIEECAKIAQMEVEEYKGFEDGLIDPRKMTFLEFAKIFRLMPVTIDPIYVLEKFKLDYYSHCNECAAGN